MSFRFLLLDYFYQFSNLNIFIMCFIVCLFCYFIFFHNSTIKKSYNIKCSATKASSLMYIDIYIYFYSCYYGEGYLVYMFIIFVVIQPTQHLAAFGKGKLHGVVYALALFYFCKTNVIVMSVLYSFLIFN